MLSGGLRPANREDNPAVAHLLSEAFLFATDPLASADELVRPGRYVYEDAGEVVATAYAMKVGQYFGGQPVPAAAVRAVAVAGHLRGGGLGQRFMSALLAHLSAEGTAVSVLYPSVPRPYRALGYALAGELRRSVARIEQFPKGVGEVVPIEPGTPDAIACYERYAATLNGPLARPKWWWRTAALCPPGTTTYSFGVRKGDALTGYVQLRKDQARPGEPYIFDVAVLDHAALTVEAERLLAAAITAYRPLGERVSWIGPSDDPWSSWIDGPPPTVTTRQWMLRIIDVQRALTTRGYSTDGFVSFALDDPHLPANCGAWELTVSDGVGFVERVRGAPLRLTVSALAALYTGWADACSLVRAGVVAQGEAAAVSRLARLLAGSPPVLLDAF